jgi:hypothetical protein
MAAKFLAQQPIKLSTIRVVLSIWFTSMLRKDGSLIRAFSLHRLVLLHHLPTLLLSLAVAVAAVGMAVAAVLEVIALEPNQVSPLEQA